MAASARTTIVALVAEAEELVASWRIRLDPWAPLGVPAHITLLAPFLPVEAIDDAVVDRVRSIWTRRKALQLVLVRVAQIPGAIALLPGETTPLEDVTADLLAEWPELGSQVRSGSDRPYHLTIACRDDRALLAELLEELAPKLPLRADLRSLVLLAASEAGEVRTLARIH
jgi:2'-5' RNA ligase superfamily protein